MEQFTLNRILELLRKLMGYHRKLLDAVRAERMALVSANLKAIQEATFGKEGLIQEIQRCEAERVKTVAELAHHWRKPASDLTILAIAVAIQGKDPKTAEQLRAAYNALTVLIKHISEQNADNGQLARNCLQHIDQMKNNVLGDAIPAANTYNPHGQKKNNATGSRLLSQEA